MFMWVDCIFNPLTTKCMCPITVHFYASSANVTNGMKLQIYCHSISRHKEKIKLERTKKITETFRRAGTFPRQITFIVVHFMESLK